MAIELLEFEYSPGIQLINLSGTPPAAPTSCAASALSAGVNRVTWSDESEDETAFVVERAPDDDGSPGAWGVIASDVDPDAQQYDDESATEGAAYWYRVKARNFAGDSDYSTAASLVTTKSAPVVSVTAPSVAAIAVTAGVLLRIEGTATDAEDGDLAASAEVLSSNTDDGDGGDLGTGLPLNIDTTGWEPGLRVVTVLAIDGDGDAGTDTFALTIGEATAGGRPGINRGLITTG